MPLALRHNAEAVRRSNDDDYCRAFTRRRGPTIRTKRINRRTDQLRVPSVEHRRRSPLGGAGRGIIARQDRHEPKANPETTPRQPEPREARNFCGPGLRPGQPPGDKPENRVGTGAKPRRFRQESGETQSSDVRDNRDIM